MAKNTTSCAKALQNWEAQHPGESATDSKVIKLNFQTPPIEKMDAPVLNTLVNCRVLSLSTNCIDKIVDLPNLRNLEILSLSRNNIKRISGLEQIGQSLKELWLSYNLIDKLDNLQSCFKLQTLFISNNKIKSWDEVDRLKELPEISTVTFIGNPIYDAFTREDARFQVLRRLNSLRNIDGTIIDDTMVDKAKTMEASTVVTGAAK